MSKVRDSDDFNPMLKLEIDEQRVGSFAEAEALVASHVLQISLGAEMARSVALQAAFLTALNTGRRAFLGGVRVRVEGAPVFDVPWARDMEFEQVLAAHGAVRAEQLDSPYPTICIGESDDPIGSVAIHAIVRGWSAAASGDRPQVPSDGNEVAGVLAGGLCVSEAFQHIRGSAVAGRRTVGFSLWRPDLDWAHPDAEGQPILYLPKAIWLLGLGHLGQAYAWTLGCLAYPRDKGPMVYLQDTDHVSIANEATSMLFGPDDLGKLKTRLTTAALEGIGFHTRVVERLYDSNQVRRAEEPDWALSGFDRVGPRRDLQRDSFTRVVDVGLGATASSYLDIALHTITPENRREVIWPDALEREANEGIDASAYQDEIARRVKDGETAEVARCGVVQIAGRSVGAAFVGASAAALAVAEHLRALAGGPQYEVVNLDLRDPRPSYAEPNAQSAPTTQLGYIEAAKP